MIGQQWNVDFLYIRVGLGARRVIDHGLGSGGSRLGREYLVWFDEAMNIS